MKRKRDEEDDDEDRPNKEHVTMKKDKTNSSGIRNSHDKDRSNDVEVITNHVLNQLISDRNALDYNSWFRDTHMDRVIKDLQKEELKNGERILFIGPTITQLLKFASAKEVELVLESEHAFFKQYIFLTVNNSKEIGGGSHWSLLVYARHENVGYHMDSSKGTNTSQAKAILDKIDQYYISHGSHAPKSTLVESRCTQQKNSYDCGPMTMLFARDAVNNINKGDPLNTCWVNEKETDKIRKGILIEMNSELQRLENGEKINQNKEKESNQNNKASNREKAIQNKEKESNLSDKEKESNQDGKTHSHGHTQKAVCKDWTIDRCWRGEKCRFAHPKMCRVKLNTGYCNSDSCNQYHPMMCRASLNHERCKWGEYCRYRHINNSSFNNGYQQRYSEDWSNPGRYPQRNNHRKPENKPHHRTSHGYPKEYNDHHPDRHGVGENWMMEDFLWSQIQPWRKRQLFDMLTETKNGRRHRY